MTNRNFFQKFFLTFLTVAIFLCCCGINKVYAAGRVAINETNFPDPIFRSVIASPDYDKDQDGYLSEYEIDMTYNLHCENLGIHSVKGIEYFESLVGIWCLNNHISEWDLSGNPHVKGIWCSFNDFKSLDFSDCPELEWVYCYNCDLRSLNVSNNPELAYMECNANPNLTKLDISKNPKLENLFCSDCGLTSLDVSNNPLLCELDAFNNDLRTLDFSNNKNLKRLDIWNNPKLGNVDVSNLKGLQFYNCAKNNVTSLDMSGNKELVMLVCSYNENLTYLNVTKNPRLAYLNLECDYRLTSLDISKNLKLYHLYAFGLLALPAINISYNSRLVKAYKEGEYKEEPHLGSVHSYTLDYGGSGDYFDDLKHELVVDDGKMIIVNPVPSDNTPDSYVNKKDGHSVFDKFVTREEAVQLLYEMAGSPEVSGTSRFKDVAPDAPYAKAIKWAEDNKICFGFPIICSDSFGVGRPLTREDFGLMAHRYAEYLGFGTAFDYGRTDWFDDFYDIEFYAWGPFTWSIQWGVVEPVGNKCYPHGRVTREELEKGAAQIFDLDEGASYSARVNGNGE